MRIKHLWKLTKPWRLLLIKCGSTLSSNEWIVERAPNRLLCTNSKTLLLDSFRDMLLVAKVSTLKLIVDITVVVMLLNILEIGHRGLWWLLESALVVNVDVGVIIIYNNDSTISRVWTDDVWWLKLRTHLLDLIVCTGLSPHVSWFLLLMHGVLFVFALLKLNLVRIISSMSTLHLLLSVSPWWLCVWLQFFLRVSNRVWWRTDRAYVLTLDNSFVFYFFLY